MYERFTDRARKTMQLANQEAQRFNHEYIGPEHVLLGICKNTGCTAELILASLELKAGRVIVAVSERLVQGPDILTMGKLPQTPRAKKVIEYAMEESRDFKHNYIGSEHLLLGCLREAEGIAAVVLDGLGVTIEYVRECSSKKPETPIVSLLEQSASMTSKEVTVCQHLVAAYHEFAELEPTEADMAMFMNGLRAMKLAVSGRILDRCWPEVWKKFGERR